jgi:hypothetical protein
MSSLIGGSMKRIHLLVLLAALALPLAAASARGSGSGSVVVAELFAAGGNSGAVYANDYVELFNRGTGAVAIDGWTLQYASASSTTWQATALSGSIPAGGRYLVQLAGGANGAALPPPDATGTSNLAVTGGKVAIVDGATALSCGAAPGSCSATAGVEDLIGYGSATDYEGSGAAPAPSATTALARVDGGCTDTDDNASDFATATPDPLNSSATASACSAPPPPPAGASASAGVDVDVQPVISIALDQPTLSFPAAVPGTTPAALPENVTVTSTDAAGYALTVHRTAFAPHDLPLGIGVADGGLVAVPIAPAADLLLATAGGPSADGGDLWTTSVGFVSPLPVVPAGHYTATLTYTVIGG